MQRRYFGVAPARAVTGHAGNAYLDADVAEAGGHDLARAIDCLRIVFALRVRIAIGGFAALASQQLVDGETGLAAFDVPQRLVDTTDGVVQDRTVAPVGRVVAGLPGVVDAVRGFACQEGLQIFFDRGHHQVGALSEGGAAIAVEAGLIGGDFDHTETQARRRGGDYAD